MSDIHLPYQKIPRWNADRATIALNCARLGLPVPKLAMPFWEGAGDKVFDCSGNRNHGTINGNLTWESNGLNFPGTNTNFLDIPVILSGLSAVTLVVRARWDADLVLSVIYEHEFGASWKYHISGARFTTRIEGNATRDDLAYTISLNKIVTLVFVWDATGNWKKIYADGVKITETLAPAHGSGVVATGNNSYFGKNADGVDFDGWIESAYFLPAALNFTQVQILTANLYGMFEPVKKPKWFVPLGATTAAPTTAAPTTTAPTTIAPTTTPVATTPSPTTSTPTTSAPTTIAPTTLAPTTAAPADIRADQVLAQVEYLAEYATTTAPTTVAPTTLAPTTLAPTTVAATTPTPPTTLFQTTAGPTTKAPTTGLATTVPPTTEPFTTIAPTTLAPTTLVPTTLAPTTLAPTTLQPTTVAPTTIGPSTVPPTTGIPEVICIKNLRSVITKEIRSDGYLC